MTPPDSVIPYPSYTAIPQARSRSRVAGAIGAPPVSAHFRRPPNAPRTREYSDFSAASYSSRRDSGSRPSAASTPSRTASSRRSRPPSRASARDSTTEWSFSNSRGTEGRWVGRTTASSASTSSILPPK